MKNLLLLLLLSNSLLLAQSSTDIIFDNNFGTNGAAIHSIGPYTHGKANEIAVQSDGKIILAGYSLVNSDWIVTVQRLLSNGQVDNSFGNNGFMRLDLDGGDDEAFDIAIQDDDKIVLIGRSWFQNPTPYFLYPKMSVSRFTTNGQIDSTFCTNGYCIFDIGNHSGGYAVDIQGNGKIILGGQAHSGSENHAVLVRLFPNGSIDSSFANNGILLRNHSVGNEIVSGLKILKDNRILACGYESPASNAYPNFFRLHPDGQIDSSFGTNGLTIVPSISGSGAFNMDFDPQGRIISGSYNFSGTNGLCQTFRLSKDGILDTSFNLNGINTYSLPPSQYNYYNTYNHVLALKNGAIVGIGAHKRSTNGRELFLHLMDSTGQTINSFGTNGIKYFAPCNNGIGGISGLSGLVLDHTSFFVTSHYCSAFSQNNMSDFFAGKFIYGDSITLSDTASHNLENTIHFEVFPNPSYGSFYVNLKTQDLPLNFEVFDLLGKRLYEGTFEAGFSELDLKKYASGCYLLRVAGTSKKLIIR